jgi:hypothetical protein
VSARRAFEALLLLGCMHCSDGSASNPGSTNTAGREAGGANSGGTNAQGGSSAGSPSAGRSEGGATPGGAGSSSAGAAGGAGAGSGGASAGTGSNGTSAGTGGAGGTSAGTNPTAGKGGEDTEGLAGAGGQFTVDRCNFGVEHSQSTAIGTVTIVTWSTDLSDLSDARIEFGPTGSDLAMRAPVDLELEGNRTLLLGMKPAKDYSFRIVASSAAETCTSPTFEVTTGPRPANVPTLTKTEPRTGGVRGFFLTTPGIGASDRGLPSAYIFDTDGDVVWWTTESVEQMGAARMSWDARAMWIVNANGGVLYRTTMDGLDTQSFSGDAQANHDIAPLPEGGVATFGRIDGKHALITVSDDGSVQPIVLLEDLYDLGGSTSYHPNALVYHPTDDTFTISDLTLEGFVKIKRNGELIWQLGGALPLGQSFELIGIEPWTGNHGHDLGPEGQFLFFNNFPTSSAGTLIIELELDEAAWTATRVWDHAISTRSQYLGGTQRLPNGNTSIVISQGGFLYEVNEAGETVQSFSNTEFNADRDASAWAVFGYAGFRETLYGPPRSAWRER